MFTEAAAEAGASWVLSLLVVRQARFLFLVFSSIKGILWTVTVVRHLFPLVQTFSCFISEVFVCFYYHFTCSLFSQPRKQRAKEKVHRSVAQAKK